MSTSDARPVGRGCQRGLGLPELLAGMAVATFVMLAALGTLRTFRDAADGGDTRIRLQREGAFAMHLIGLHLRQAGAVEPAVATASGLYAFRGSGTAAAGGDGTAAGGTGVSGSSGAPGTPDSLTVVVVPMRPSSGAAASAAPQYDCSGARIESESAVTTRFEVDAAGRLMCRARNRQPVIEEVADFRLRYRVRSGSAELRDLDAATVERLRLWDAVRAVEVCLELAADFHGPPRTHGEPGCDGRPTPAAGRLHRVFRQWYSLRTKSE